MRATKVFKTSGFCEPRGRLKQFEFANNLEPTSNLKQKSLAKKEVVVVMMFKRSTQNQNRGESLGNPTNVGKITSVTFLLVIGLAILTFAGFQVKGFYDRIVTNWAEIKFASEKPHLVREMRENYEQKQKELDESFTKQEKTVEQKLIEELTLQLSEERSKR